ncbi:ead/Ea22-like family protein [Prosthecomicrobium hirschii]|uniref:ead/Ea22-like family protein n=1 Tax=Prosthecodimorpha hirschii TaxID=665126 RepID=UPI00221FC04B|nr:ead/Ea22-like family protein [Prosthecomicrobium hirschii]MCW1839484.1 ead/Ea22-like family protein [Prosthecomicrobium hirschii]
MPDIDTGRTALRARAEAATPGPWQVVVYRTPFAFARHDGTTCSGEHVGRDIATVRHHPQSHAPDPIVTLGIGVTQETPVPFVYIRPEDADYLAAVSPEVVLALLDAVDMARAAATPLLRWLDQMETRYGSHPDDIRLAGFADAGVTYGDLRRLRAAIGPADALAPTAQTAGPPQGQLL